MDNLIGLVQKNSLFYRKSGLKVTFCNCTAELQTPNAQLCLKLTDSTRIVRSGVHCQSRI